MMDGVEKIIDAIAAETQAKADEITGAATEKAEGILKKAGEEQDALVKRLTAQAETESRQIIERGAAADRQNRKQALLKVRQSAIEGAIAAAKETVLSLPPGEYFDFLYKIFVKNARAENGKIYFAPRDFERLPDGYIDRLNSGLGKGAVELAGNTNAIANGFIITYGKIEQNCSVDGIFESNRNELSDAVNAYFAQGG